MKKNAVWRWLLPLLLVLALALAQGVGLLPRAQSVLPGAETAARAEDKAFKTLKKGGSGQEVRRAQEALKALGFYEGKTDGNFSKAFEEAVRAFQEYMDLPADGRIDEDLYLLLTEDLPPDSAMEAPKPKPAPTASPRPPTETEAPFVVRYEDYSDKDHVAAYIHLFGELPPNYITKDEARDMGWVESRGNLGQAAPEMSIGGDRFLNYEGKLPNARGRKYFECDIDYDPTENWGYRNGKRIIYSNDGLIFYTEDHYQTFEEITFP